MLTDKRFWTLALVLSVCVLAAAGCRRKSSDDNDTNDDDIFTTDSFPGGAVQEGNVADDGRAFSPSGQDFTGSMRITYNGDRGTCMVTYVTDGVNVYAQYYDGATWTPPVSLNAIDITTTSAAGFAFNICHAFINTSEHVSSEARARDGDCLIFWRANDVDSDGAGSDAANTCLLSTYFDVTEKDNIALNHGFQEFATRLNVEEEGGENVQTVALVTDGLCGEARWSTNGNNYSYGDQTTSIVVVWRQIDVNDVGGGGFADANLHAARFNPADLTVETSPLVPSATTELPILGFGSSNGGITSNETMLCSEYCTYNETIFFIVKHESGVGWLADPSQEAFHNYGSSLFVDTDLSIQEITFDLETSTFNVPATVNLGPIDGTDLDNNVAEFLKEENSTGGGTLATTFLNNCNGIYGADEGLAATVLFYVHLNEDPDASTAGDFGEAAAADIEEDGRVCIAEINAANGAVLETAALNFTDATVVAPNDTVDEGDIDTRISRNGDYIWVSWLQRNSSGLTDEVGLRTVQYQTTRIMDDGTIPVPPLFGTSLSLDFFVNTDSDGETVHWFMFQDHLGYVCGAQSDPDIMHLYFEQSRDDSADLIDEVFVSTLDADVTGFPTVAVVTAGVTWQVFELGDQPGSGEINNEHNCFNATDSGEGGNIFSVYTADVNALLGTDDFRLFGDGSGLNGGFDEIDSEVSFRQTPQQTLTLVATPPGSEIGVFDVTSGSDSNARPHASRSIHVLFAENESTEDSGLGFALRTRQFRTDDSSAIAFSGRFTPDATTGAGFLFPFDLDLPNIDPNGGDDATVVGIALCDETVGVWFTEMSHIYYQECSGGSSSEVGWLNIDGESNPYLVDDDNDEELQSFVTFETKSCTCCDLDQALVFWTKAFGSGSGGGFSQRLQVRVRSGGN